MNNKILILGKGFIGQRLQESFNCNISDRKIYKFSDAEEEVKKYRPKIIINCIGHTGISNVDDCELDKDRTIFANTFVPLLLAEVAIRNRIKLVHISSGCIYHFDYSKDKPIDEEAVPDFFDLFYSRSKIYADRSLKVLSSEFDVLIIRIRVPLDIKPHSKNLLTRLINYNRIIDVPNSVTYIPDFIKALRYLIRINARGIFNVVNKGGLRYPRLLETYKKYVPGYRYEFIDFKKLNLIRTNVVLSTKKLEKTGFKVRSINEVLEECVKEYLKY